MKDITDNQRQAHAAQDETHWDWSKPKALKPPSARRARQLVTQVAHEFGFTVDDLVSKDRHQSLAHARQVAMYVLRKAAGCSYPEIGILLQRDHTTAMTGVAKIQRRLDEGDDELRDRIDVCTRTQRKCTLVPCGSPECAGSYREARCG